MMTDRSTTRMELAQRCGSGVEVTLVWLQGECVDETVVCVRDSLEGSYFEIPVEPYLALDVYYHPFAYRDFSRVDVADDRLVAQAMVEAGVYATRSAAEVAHAALAAAGIPSVLTADDAGGAYPFVLSGGARLFVNEADADAAADLLAYQSEHSRKERS